MPGVVSVLFKDSHVKTGSGILRMPIQLLAHLVKEGSEVYGLWLHPRLRSQQLQCCQQYSLAIAAERTSLFYLSKYHKPLVPIS